MSSKFIRGLVLAGVVTASIATAAAPASAATPSTTAAVTKAAVQVAAPAQAPTAAKGAVESYRHRGGWCGGRRGYFYRGCRYPTWLPYGFAGSYYYGGPSYYPWDEPGFFYNNEYDYGYNGITIILQG